MLQSLSILDNEINEFSIDQLLVKIAFSNHRLLPISPTILKRFLPGQEIVFNSIPMIITLYGGLKRDGSAVVFYPFYIYRESTAITPILIRFLFRSNQHENITMIKSECLK
ncbi:unnamed protein product, partial [Rotaria sp. Silwood2]